MEYWTSADGVDSPWCLARSGQTIYAGRSLGSTSSSSVLAMAESPLHEQLEPLG
jgi:hypothetical protein